MNRLYHYNLPDGPAPRYSGPPHRNVDELPDARSYKSAPSRVECWSYDPERMQLPELLTEVLRDVAADQIIMSEKAQEEVRQLRDQARLEGPANHEFTI